MSRIGKKPIVIPAGVKVTIADGGVTVEGKAKLSMTLPPRVAVTVSGPSARSLVSLSRSSSSPLSGSEKKKSVAWGRAEAAILPNGSSEAS